MALRESGFGVLPIVDVEPELLVGFECGKSHLDRFLASDGVDMHLDRLGLTSVVFHADVPGTVVGFFTLSNDGIPLTTSEQQELGLRGEFALTAFPAVKLGRLAVAKRLQGQGVGRQLMDLVLGEILDSASLSAARLVVVDADNDPPVLAFYRQLGFQDSLWAQRQARNHGGGRRADPPAAVKMVRDILSSAPEA